MGHLKQLNNKKNNGKINNMEHILCDDFEIIELGEQEIDVYDIEVEDNHNFFANDILIHNSVYVNCEPLVPAILKLYRPIIEHSLNQKNPDILKELDSCDFWDNIYAEFKNESELVKKYFSPQDMNWNGIIEQCIKVEVDKDDNKKMKSFCDENKIDYIFRRRGENESIHYFIVGDSVPDIKILFAESGINIKSITRTYPIDDFANTIIQDIINDNYSDLCQYLNAKNKMVMKREAVCTNGFWLGSKNYVLSIIDSEGVVYAEPKIKITGALKSKTPAKIRPFFEDFIRVLLTQRDRKSAESLVILNKIVKDFVDFIDELTIEDLGMNVTVNDIEKHIGHNGMPRKGKSVPVHSYGAIIFNKYVKENDLKEYPYIAEGEKVKYLYLIEQNPFDSHVVSFKDEGLPKGFEKYVDKDKMIEKAFYDMLDIIIKSSGIELKYQRECESLDSWLL